MKLAANVMLMLALLALLAENLEHPVCLEDEVIIFESRLLYIEYTYKKEKHRNSCIF